MAAIVAGSKKETYLSPYLDSLRSSVSIQIRTLLLQYSRTGDMIDHGTRRQPFHG